MTGFKKFSKKLCEVLIVDNDKGYMSLRRRCPGAKSIHFVITISLITKELTTETHYHSILQHSLDFLHHCFPELA